MKFRSLSLLASALVLGGCVSVDHRTLTADTSGALAGKSVATTRYETPDLAATTAGKAAFGMVGAAGMIAAGNTIVRENEIPDPAVTIGELLTSRAIANRGMTRVAADTVAAKDKPADLLATYPQADYLLDVKTFYWGFAYYPTDWSHYRVIYNARMRLIERATGTVVAETLCRTTQGDEANPPTRDQLLADEATLLKSYLDKSATQCADLLAREVLAM